MYYGIHYTKLNVININSPIGDGNFATIFGAIEFAKVININSPQGTSYFSEKFI